MNLYYPLLLQEAAAVIESERPVPNWPMRGTIEFRSVAFRYRVDLPRVLHDVSLIIRGGEKVGVVGRTGADIVYCLDMYNTLILNG